uniref:Unnamed protein product n=1 Tax=Macaca fascicularis TaxID=9541 RepID=Q9N0B4_MACFA|nr:unnamed protein product [Macaca fascicularis]
MKLTLGPHGIRMQPCERGTAGGSGGRRPAHAYLLPRITYCTADGHHPRVFAWVYRHQARHKAVVLRCHAVLLARAHKARALARLLRQTALAAFSDFKRLQLPERCAPRAPVASPRGGRRRVGAPRPAAPPAQCQVRLPAAAERAQPRGAAPQQHPGGGRRGGGGGRRGGARGRSPPARAAGGAQPGPGAEDVQPAGRPGAPTAGSAPPLEGRPQGAGGPGALRAEGQDSRPQARPARLTASNPGPARFGCPGPRPVSPRGLRVVLPAASFWLRVMPDTPFVIGGCSSLPTPGVARACHCGPAPYALHPVSLPTDLLIPSQNILSREEVSRNQEGGFGPWAGWRQ